MFVIIGILVVFGAVVAGYLMEHGNLKVLIQPAELVIIGGAAVGTVLISNPLYILKAIISGLLGAFGGSKYGKENYLDTMKMMYELFGRARKEGLMVWRRTVMLRTRARSFPSTRNCKTMHCHTCATQFAWRQAGESSRLTSIK